MEAERSQYVCGIGDQIAKAFSRPDGWERSRIGTINRASHDPKAYELSSALLEAVPDPMGTGISVHA